MKKIIVFLCIFAILIPAFSFNTFAATAAVPVLKTAVAPKIDGDLDEGYNLIADSKKDTKLFIVDTFKNVANHVQIYSCWDNEFLYIFVKADCTEPHIAYMDNAKLHWIFNAHYMMTAICPDDPTLAKYKGTADDKGGWDYTALYNANYMYEYTVIEDSNDGKNVISDHFSAISTKTGFVYDVKSGGGFDCYEQKIPLKQLITSQAANGVNPTIGSVLGLGIAVGFSDVGFDYALKADTVEYSTYFSANKTINGLMQLKLESTLAEESNITSSDATSGVTSTPAVTESSEPTISEAPNSKDTSSKVSYVSTTSTNSDDGTGILGNWWIIASAAAVVIVIAAAFIIFRRKKI